MPLLMCPNCQAGMKQVNRESVEIDICPECRGIWLDRGELEKLLNLADAQSGNQPPAVPMPPPLPPQGGAYYPPQPYPDYYGGGHREGGFLRRFLGGGHH